MTDEPLPPFLFTFYIDLPRQGPGDDQNLKTVRLPYSAWNEFYASQKKKIQDFRKGNLTSEESEIIHEIEYEILNSRTIPGLLWICL